jgi:DUF971 family protein
VIVEVPERIEIEGGDGIRLTWADGTTTLLTAAGLRASCPCAECAQPIEARDLTAKVAAMSPWTIAGAELVGDYALGLVFEPDGHGTGIYTFDLLASLVGREPGP